jgi:hypothetical protein
MSDEVQRCLNEGNLGLSGLSEFGAGALMKRLTRG